MKEQLQLTAVWRNGGCSGKLNSSFLNQNLCLVDSEVLRKPPLRQVANLGSKCIKTYSQEMKKQNKYDYVISRWTIQ